MLVELPEFCLPAGISRSLLWLRNGLRRAGTRSEVWCRWEIRRRVQAVIIERARSRPAARQLGGWRWRWRNHHDWRLDRRRFDHLSQSFLPMSSVHRPKHMGRDTNTAKHERGFHPGLLLSLKRGFLSWPHLTSPSAPAPPSRHGPSLPGAPSALPHDAHGGVRWARAGASAPTAVPSVSSRRSR